VAVSELAVAMSPPLAALIATVLALIIRIPLQRFGHWLERKGTEMERGRR
jgi:hypothetical protein